MHRHKKVSLELFYSFVVFFIEWKRFIELWSQDFMIYYTLRATAFDFDIFRVTFKHYKVWILNIGSFIEDISVDRMWILIYFLKIIVIPLKHMEILKSGLIISGIGVDRMWILRKKI